MTDIQQSMRSRFKAEGYDLVDLIPIPVHGDRMVRFRTLQEALEDFDADAGSETISYLIQVRPERKSENTNSELHQAAPATTPSLNTESVYLPDGKLNLVYLVKNAELLFAAGDYALSRNIYDTIRQAGQSSGVALYWIGRCFEAEGRLEDAGAAYDESITYQSTLVSYQRYANLLIRQKKDHQAAEVLERALNLKNISDKLRFELHKAAGNCWMRAEKTSSAEHHYRRALSIEPSADEIQANLGALNLQAGKTSEARRIFHDALASNPRNEKALSGMGSCWLADNEKQKAHDYFAKSLEINLQNPSAVFHLVKCAYEIKSYTTAARILGDYVESAPVNLNLLYSLAGLQFHVGRMQEARSTANRILNIQPGHSGANELLKLIDQYSGT